MISRMPPIRTSSSLTSSAVTSSVKLVRGLDPDREQDVGGEDQVVDDVGEHDVALAGQRVVVEDVGGVRAAEPLDERTEPERDGDQDDVRGDLQDPPGHVQSLLVLRGQGESQRGGREQPAGPQQGDAADPTSSGAVVGDAADHPGEQVGRRLGVRAGVAEGVVQPDLEAVAPGQPSWASRVAARPRRPRLRWVFTEFGDRPSASAISSTDSSR